MKQFPLDAQSRQIGTKGALNKHRKDGFIPGIVYGHKEKSMPVLVKEKDFMKLKFLIYVKNVIKVMYIEKNLYIKDLKDFKQL